MAKVGTWILFHAAAIAVMIGAFIWAYPKIPHNLVTIVGICYLVIIGLNVECIYRWIIFIKRYWANKEKQNGEPLPPIDEIINKRT